MSGERRISIWAWHWWTWNLSILNLKDNFLRYLKDININLETKKLEASQKYINMFHRLCNDVHIYSEIKNKNPDFSNIDAIENFIGSKIYKEISSGKFHDLVDIDILWEQNFIWLPFILAL